MSARSYSWRENGLEHHVLAWGDAGPVVVLVHGFQDAAATFDDVAEALAADGFRVFAPDMRGFGDGERPGAGAYYYFPDYVADLAAIAAGRLPTEVPPIVVGHSMGATIVTQYAGALPERVGRLVLVDGVGPPDNPFEFAPVRMRRWIETVNKRRGAADDAAQFATLDEAVARFRRNQPDLDDAVLRRRVAQLVRPAGDGLRWKFDPLHTTMSPIPFYGKAYEAFARAVTCPVLHVSGGPKGNRLPEEDERLACFASLSRVTIDGGHMLHWTKPRELARAIAEFGGASRAD